MGGTIIVRQQRVGEKLRGRERGRAAAGGSLSRRGQRDTVFCCCRRAGCEGCPLQTSLGDEADCCFVLQPCMVEKYYMERGRCMYHVHAQSVGSSSDESEVVSMLL